MKARQWLIERALVEDRVRQDKTSLALFSPEHLSSSFLIAKQSGILAGILVAEQVFQAVDRKVRFEPLKRDGEWVKKGERIAHIQGRTRSLLSAERVALNFLMHLSGIATLTAKFKNALKGTPAILLDTRKTLPGLRELEKYAVRCGGGKNHRMSLSDAILIKSNHIQSFGSLSQMVALARKKYLNIFIEVEVKNIRELQEALKTPVNRIMLDNFLLTSVRRAVALRDQWANEQGKRIPLEASGGITLKKVRQLARAGVDYISVGSLTHSAPALNISMKIANEGRRAG